jgi:GNAT superfamily N-acetyltransferase
MSLSANVRVREAGEQDVGAIKELFQAAYCQDYPYPAIYDETALKKAIFGDDVVIVVAEAPDTGRVLGTASVLFDTGAQSDLVAEFGRLVVRPDERAHGVGGLLMAERIRRVEGRLHVGLVENRAIHPFSQKISQAHGFAPVGFQVGKHRFRTRENTALFCRHFEQALPMRRNNPHLIPEAHSLASLALQNCGLPADVIVDEESAAYPPGANFCVEQLAAPGMPALLRIERGRVRNREVFGPMRLQYGFFKLSARSASYLVAREDVAGGRAGPIAGAIGYIRDDREKSVRIFELISRTDAVIRVLLDELLARCRGEWDVEYLEIDISAHAPAMQRTLLELGFLPSAYVPAMVFHEVERLDVVKMSRLLATPPPADCQVVPTMKPIVDSVLQSISRQAVLPQVAQAMHRIAPFQGLNPEQSARLAGICQVRHFSRGQPLFSLGADPDEMFILIRGNVEVTLGDPPRRLGTVAAGDSLGELSLLTGEPHSAGARAMEEVTTAVLSRAAVRALTRERPDIGVILYRQLAIGLGRKLQRLDASVLEARPT